MAMTAEGALSQINDRLQRVRQLTVQGLNGTLNLGDTDAIQREINLNLKEIDRLNEQAKFNGINLLDGSAGQIDIQVGANDNETLPLDLSPPGFSVNELGLKNFTIAGISDTVAPINVVSGQAFDIPVVSPKTTLSFNGRSTSNPVLMESDTPGYKNRRYTRSDTPDGPVYYLSNVQASPAHDTASGDNRVTVNVGDELYASVDEVGGVNLSSADVSYQAADGTVLENVRLVATSSQYFIAQGTGTGTRYFKADVEISKPDQGSSKPAQIMARARSGEALAAPSFKKVKQVNGHSTITLDPRNVTVNYTDHAGTASRMRCAATRTAITFSRPHRATAIRRVIGPPHWSKASTLAHC